MNDSQNIEFKAKFRNVKIESDLSNSYPILKNEVINQTDTYFYTKSGKLKIRNNNDTEFQLISYHRLNAPTSRPSSFSKVDITSIHEAIYKTLDRSLGCYQTVTKKRNQLSIEHALINVDEIENIGKFIEIEVFVTNDFDINKATELSLDLKKILKISQNDIVSFSYPDLLSMKNESILWRSKYNENDIDAGKIFLIDGVSCSGKTTLTQKLLNDKNIDLDLIPRYTTRDQRKGEESESEYIFIDYDEFERKISHGMFIEFRDFEFGMSYGLPWEEAVDITKSQKHALGIINLGNSAYVKELFPEATMILIDAPIETIKSRLIARGKNTQEQIEERLSNAAMIKDYKENYDYIINNEEGKLEHCFDQLKKIILS